MLEACLYPFSFGPGYIHNTTNLNFRTAACNTQNETQGETSTISKKKKDTRGSIANKINNLLGLTEKGGGRWSFITVPERSHLWVEHSVFSLESKYSESRTPASLLSGTRSFLLCQDQDLKQYGAAGDSLEI